MREAMYYDQGEDQVICSLCPKSCRIKKGMTGFCRVRRNIEGKLYTENYGYCSSYALDPIEKKPLYHFYPGSTIFSIGTWGCNFACQFCQNWQIAQETPVLQELSPERAVDTALGFAGNLGLAYTYSEPGVWFEQVLETAKLAKKKGLKNVLVTNGFINTEPLLELLPFIDALNIDVKAFSQEFYGKVCQGILEDVKHTVEIAARQCHVEITTLLIPGLNDKETDISAMAEWLSMVNPDIPLHFSRYFPQFKMAVEKTPEATLVMASKAARKYLNYVYIGNLASDGVNTYCPACGQLLIDRLKLQSYITYDKHCPRCGSAIPIVGTVSF